MFRGSVKATGYRQLRCASAVLMLDTPCSEVVWRVLATGSRGVRNSGSNAGYTMFRGSVKSTGYWQLMCASALVMLDTPCSEIVWRVLANHSIRHFPLHLPFRASPCAITFQLEPTAYISALRMICIKSNKHNSWPTVMDTIHRPHTHTHTLQ